MKLIRIITRPERETQLLDGLESEDFFAITKIPVRGRGSQGGIQVGAVSYDQLSKLMFLLVVEDNDLDRAVLCIEKNAQTGYPGDGKIFIQEVREAYTIRNGERQT